MLSTFNYMDSTIALNEPMEPVSKFAIQKVEDILVNPVFYTRGASNQLHDGEKILQSTSQMATDQDISATEG